MALFAEAVKLAKSACKGRHAQCTMLGCDEPGRYKSDLDAFDMRHSRLAACHHQHNGVSALYQIPVCSQKVGVRRRDRDGCWCCDEGVPVTIADKLPQLLLFVLDVSSGFGFDLCRHTGLRALATLQSF